MRKRMNNRLVRAAAMLILAAMLFSTAAISFAWLAEMQNENIPVSGSSITSYFGGGDGSSEHPYIINHPIHLYNLSWLQNLGKFASKTYFSLTADLNMAGELDRDTGYSGAIPPIGSEAHPFVGEFIGNGKTISNLWVSSKPSDWKEKPAAELSPVGSQIGFFGATGGGAQVSNFVLKNIEVTVAPDENVTGSFTVGLVAGYVNSDISNVGVDNGKLDLQGVLAKSESSLVGARGPDVKWTDAPVGSPTLGGSELHIDPNEVGHTFAAINPSGDNPTYAEVPGASNHSAFYVSTLNRGNVNRAGKYKTLMYTPLITWASGNTTYDYTAGSGNTRNVVSTDVEEDMYNKITQGGTVYYIMPNVAAPNTTDLCRVNDISKSVPINGIWFKPQVYGDCYVAITKANSSGDENLSMYSYRRYTEEDTIPSGKSVGDIKDDTWGEIELVLDGGHLKNKDVAAFKISIPKTAVTEGYEFVIGKSRRALNGGGTAGFLYLILAGSGNQGYTPENPLDGIYTMNKIDYTHLNASSEYPILVEENYTPKKLLLEIPQATATASLIYTMNGSGQVLYNNGTVVNARINAATPPAALSESIAFNRDQTAPTP